MNVSAVLSGLVVTRLPAGGFEVTRKALDGSLSASKIKGVPDAVKGIHIRSSGEGLRFSLDT